MQVFLNTRNKNPEDQEKKKQTWKEAREEMNIVTEDESFRTRNSSRHLQ